MLSLINISKSFGATIALNGISFDLAAEPNRGEIVALLGPSGCGKSTLLSIIAGLEAPDNGDVLWDGHSLKPTPPHRRGFGLMFQDYALFPHLNVFDNVAFGLRMGQKGSQKSLNTVVAEMLELVGLSGYERRDVNTLSGGEQQRVALARALAPSPRLLMLDEPLGALDRNLRERLLVDLHAILRNVQQPALYVTHDLKEAFALADRVILMNAGRIEQIGAPRQLFQHPATPFAAQFLGLTNFVPGTIHNTWVETPVGSFPAPGYANGPVTVLLRPDAVRLAEDVFHLEGEIASISFRGNTCRAEIIVHGFRLAFEFLASAALPNVGEHVLLEFDPAQAIQIFPRS